MDAAHSSHGGVPKWENAALRLTRTPTYLKGGRKVNRDTHEIKIEPKYLKTNEKRFSNRDSHASFLRRRLAGAIFYSQHVTSKKCRKLRPLKQIQISTRNINHHSRSFTLTSPTLAASPGHNQAVLEPLLIYRTEIRNRRKSRKIKNRTSL